MKTYTKINTLYRRYLPMKGIKVPDEKYRNFSGQIILKNFSDSVFEYLMNNLWDATSKIDGTNSKIAFYPSTGKYAVGGKTDNASSQSGQFEMLTAIAERILPKLKKIFPPETAKFEEVKDKATNKVVYTPIDDQGTVSVKLTEMPIYIYGEYYGNGIQKVGKRYRDDNGFVVFDICQQGWWLPKDKRDQLCHELGIDQVPYLGQMTITDAEKAVRSGFKTRIKANDPTLIEEGIVLQSPLCLKDARGNRLIVKIKHCDYAKYDAVRKEFTDEEFATFNKWYNDNIESINL